MIVNRNEGIDMKNLSKIKYIYYIHGDINDCMHVEKYPVIYINSDLVYFKMQGMNELCKVQLKSVWSSYSRFIARNTMSDTSFYMYCFEITDNQIKSILKDNKIRTLKNRIRSLNSHINSISSMIDRLTFDLNMYKEDIERSEAQLNEIMEGNAE